MCSIDPLWIAAPLTGCVIGALTNEIAIRMLFRPLTPKFLFGWHIPLTPGLIPKERNTLAKSIGRIVSQELLTPAVLEAALLNESMYDKLRQALRQTWDHYQQEERPLGQALESILSLDQQAQLQETLCQSISQTLGEKLASEPNRLLFAQGITQHIRNRIQGKFLLAMTGDLASNIGEHLSRELQQLFREKGPEFLYTLTKQEGEQLLNTPVSHLLAQYGEHFPQWEEALLCQYQKSIPALLPKLLCAVDLGTVVEERICAYDLLELEKLLLEVTQKELKAIVWLGGGLGFLLGFVNVGLTRLLAFLS